MWWRREPVEQEFTLQGFYILDITKLCKPCTLYYTCITTICIYLSSWLWMTTSIKILRLFHFWPRLRREELRVGSRLDGLDGGRGAFMAEDATVGRRVGGGCFTAENVCDGKKHVQVRWHKKQPSIIEWMLYGRKTACALWSGLHTTCTSGSGSL